MAETVKGKCDPDNETYCWFPEKLEETTDAFVKVSTSRFEELIRAEHTNELIAKVIGENSPFKYDCERKTVLDLLLGNEVSTDE